MSHEDVELVRSAIETLNAGGIEAVLPFYPPDVVMYAIAEWVEDPVYRGHDGVRRLTAAWTENFDDFTWEIHEIRDVQGRSWSLRRRPDKSRARAYRSASRKA